MHDAADQFEPHADAVRFTEAAVATDRRRQRRAVRLMCVAGALFGAGVIGLGLPVRMDAGKVSAGLPDPGTVPPSPTTAAPPSSYIAFTSSPSSIPVVTTAAPPTLPTTTTTVPQTQATSARTAQTAAARNVLVQPLNTQPQATTPPQTVPPTTPPTTAATTTTTTTVVPPTPPTPAPPLSPPPPTPPPIAFTVHWRSPDCAAPVFSSFFGTAEPGSTVTISGSFGSATASVDSDGRWGRFLFFPGVSGPPAITVSSPQGTVNPACGS
jgi:hypothetical protein